MEIIATATPNKWRRKSSRRGGNSEGTPDDFFTSEHDTTILSEGIILARTMDKVSGWLQSVDTH